MEKVSQKPFKTFLVYLQIFIFAFLLPLFWMEYSSVVYQVILVLVFLECILLSFTDKAFNIYQIFLFMMFLFNVSLPVMELFGWYSYPQGNMIMLSDGVEVMVSDEALAITYKVIITMLLGTSVGWLIGIFKFNLYNRRGDILLSNVIVKNRNLFCSLFFILLPLAAAYNSMRLYYSTIYGYVEVMHLHSVSGSIPYVFRFAYIVYPLAGYSMLFQARNKKEYIKYAVLFMLPYFIQMFTGARGETIAVFFTVIFIYSYYFEQIKIRRIVPAGILVFVLANVIGAYRFSRNYDYNLLDVSASRAVASIVSCSKSMGVIAYTVELKDQFFNKVPFLFGYIHAIFSFTPNYTYEGIQNKNYLAQHITYLLNSNKLYGGSTIGTAMGAEFYEFSNGYMIFIFILSIILLYCACYFIKNLFKNQFMFYIGAMYIEILCLSPRGSIMKIINKESVLCIAILVFITLLTRYRKTPVQNKEQEKLLEACE